MGLLLAEIGVELAMIAATVAAVWCFVHLLILFAIERRELHERARRRHMQMSVSRPEDRRDDRPLPARRGRTAAPALRRRQTRHA